MPAAVIAVGAGLVGSGAAGLAVSAGLVAAGSIGATIISSAVAFGVQALGSSLIGGGDSGSAINQELARGVLLNTSSTVEPIPVIYGTRRVGGARVFGPVVSGNSNALLHMAFAWCEGEVDRISSVEIDHRVSSASFWDGVVRQLEHALGADDQVAFAGLRGQKVGWTTEHRMAGVAGSYLRLGFDADKTSGIPTVTALVRGRLLYDPRDGSTAWSDNPALAIRDYLTNARYGRGIPESAIDDASIIEAANYCDQAVEVPDGEGGTTTQARYTCNGVVDVDRTPLANVSELLTCCRGMLIFTGGKYRLRIDKPETPTFAFTEDNIVGAWTIKPGDKRSLVNRVQARFFNANERYQPDLALWDSPALRTADNGLLLEREIALPFTSDRYRAEQLVQMELRQSRQAIAVVFRATIEALRVEVGDVVTITHSTPDWSAKEFRVLRLSLLGNDEVEVTAREYDANVYNLEALETDSASPDTDLPDPFDVALPGAPVVTESLYVTRDGGGVKAQASLSWEASPDAFVDVYQVEYRPDGAASWTVLPRTPATTLNVLDLTPALYEWRVKAINQLGVSSEYSTSEQEIYGLGAPPTEPQGLTISAAGGLAILRWDQSQDLDVRIGGRIEFRHSPAQSGATWTASSSIGNAVAGSETVAILPLKPGTYLAKAVDSSGVRSTAAAAVATKGATVLAYSTVDTVSEHSTFAGTHSNTVVAAGVLKLDAGGLVDDISDVDAVVNWDAEGGIEASGTYGFASGMDLSTVKRVRLRATVASQLVHTTDTIDERTELVDDWEDFDGDSAGAAGDVQVWVRETDDDPASSPTWSAWNRLDSAEYEARAFQFEARLSVTDSTYNIHIDELSVTAEEVT